MRLNDADKPNALGEIVLTLSSLTIRLYLYEGRKKNNRFIQLNRPNLKTYVILGVVGRVSYKTLSRVSCKEYLIIFLYVDRQPMKDGAITDMLWLIAITL